MLVSTSAWTVRDFSRSTASSLPCTTCWRAASIVLSALVKSSAIAAFPLPVKTQLVPGRFGGKAVLAEDSGGKTELPVEVWLGRSARRLPILGEVVGSEEWPALQDRVHEQNQHGSIYFQQPAGGLGRLLLLLAPIGSVNLTLVKFKSQP